MEQPPLFIISSGRAGSTIFHRILCEHPSVSWLTALADKYPGRPGLQRKFMGAVDIPVAGRVFSKIYPEECYTFWEYLVPGFRRPCRDLRDDDVTVRNANRVREALRSIPTVSRPLLSLKLTGWPRIGMLNEIFPDARFIHVIRDGRAVANSFLAVPWWLGWGGPEKWRWGPLSQEHLLEWEENDRSFVALAAIQWKIYLNAYESSIKSIAPERLLEVRYEDLCNQNEEVFSTVLDFCNLENSNRFTQALAKFKLHSEDAKWRRDLKPHQQAILEQSLEANLRKYNYT
ncbi:sulfotransferase [Verrucomicrobiales bacterium]|nr:sulfotransferase [Verrucomicrobiales bacterium]